VDLSASDVQVDVQQCLCARKRFRETGDAERYFAFRHRLL
jgi:hypothetical protein